MPAFRDTRSNQWRYRKRITFADGRAIRISGTPAIDTKAAAEAAEAAHVMRVLRDGHAPIGRPTATGEARTHHAKARCTESELAAWARFADANGYSSVSDMIREAVDRLMHGGKR